MSEPKKTPVEFRTNGTLADKGVAIIERSSIDALSSRGYGSSENEVFILTFYESLYLLDKGMLEVKDEKATTVNFQRLLHCYEDQDENAWANYLIYRDLRSRGYVVREGFGPGADFRFYERGSYGKDTAPYLVLSTQEGKPVQIADLSSALQKCQRQKKELIVAVINRRGEIVYYSVGGLRFTSQI
jgi:tRNA-intron endonuclease